MPESQPPTSGQYPARPQNYQSLLANRLVRLLRIREAIAARPGIHRYELAEAFGVSERRIQEDLTILIAAGVRIHRVSRGYELAE